jgi:GYF domain 2
MNYFIKRELNEYGPYTLADLQKYVASGNILLTDLCRSEGMTDWGPVSQVIGNIPVPAAPQPGAMAGAGAYAAPAISPYPAPPSLHWGITLLLTLVTCFIFGWVWLFVQAAWVKKVQPASKAIVLFAVAVGLYVAVLFASMSLAFAARSNPTLLGMLAMIRILNIVAWVIMMTGCFNMKNSIEEHFTTAEPIGLSLSGVITFIMSFFGLGQVYFQYHFTRINEMKNRQVTGYPA